MTLSGVTLTGTPSRYCLHLPSKPGSSCVTRVSFFLDNGKSGQLTHLQRNDWSSPIRRCSMLKAPMFCRAMNAAFGDSTDDYAIFPRINIGDPYKRLGISREASEEEIQAARNFLIQRYGGHKPSVDAIESAHDIVIMRKFYERRNPPINFMKYIRAVTQSHIVQAVRSSFKIPSRSFIIKTFAAFAILGALTVLFPTEDGPTVQVAMSLVATIYFMHDQLKSVWRALFYGTGAFLFSWLFGTFLVVSVIPPIVKGPRSLEVSTSVISYALLWVSSTYLRLC